MVEQKDNVASAISKAQEDLEDALTELEKMPAFEAGAVSFAAHALNNYLTVMGGAIDLILARLADHPDQQLQVFLESAQHARDLMARIVSQLMDSTAPQQTPIRLVKFELFRLVQRACSYYQRIANRKRIRLMTRTAGDVPMAWADRVMVAAVLDNLLSNAIKYSPHEKQVLVEVRGEDAWVICGVHDQGPGLSEEDQSKLFQRGVLLTPQPTGGEPSTGYGLAVAKTLIEKQGGTIWCESVLGEGASFFFRVPAYREPEQDSGRISVEIPPG